MRFARCLALERTMRPFTASFKAAMRNMWVIKRYSHRRLRNRELAQYIAKRKGHH